MIMIQEKSFIRMSFKTHRTSDRTRGAEAAYCARLDACGAGIRYTNVADPAARGNVRVHLLKPLP